MSSGMMSTEIELLGHLVESDDEVGDDADELPDAEVHQDVNQLGDGGSPAGHLAHVVQFFVFVFAHSNLKLNYKSRRAGVLGFWGRT